VVVFDVFVVVVVVVVVVVAVGCCWLLWLLMSRIVLSFIKYDMGRWKVKRRIYEFMNL